MRAALGLSVATSLLLTASCASVPPVAEKQVMAPIGTVTTYHRKSSGSLGTFDGKVVWTHTASTWQDKPVVSFGAPQAGVALHDPVNHDLLAMLDPNGKPIMSYDPPMKYRWPLVVGSSWQSSHTATLHATGRTIPLQIDWKVESWGDVTVPAGTFKAYRLVWTNKLGEVATRWTSPSEGIATIKRHAERPGTHPQGAGVLEAERLSVVLLAK